MEVSNSVNENNQRRLPVLASAATKLMLLGKKAQASQNESLKHNDSRSRVTTNSQLDPPSDDDDDDDDDEEEGFTARLKREEMLCRSSLILERKPSNANLLQRRTQRRYSRSEEVGDDNGEDKVPTQGLQRRPSSDMSTRSLQRRPSLTPAEIAAASSFRQRKSITRRGSSTRRRMDGSNSSLQLSSSDLSGNFSASFDDLHEPDGIAGGPMMSRKASFRKAPSRTVSNESMESIGRRRPPSRSTSGTSSRGSLVRTPSGIETSMSFSEAEIPIPEDSSEYSEDSTSGNEHGPNVLVETPSKAKIDSKKSLTQSRAPASPVARKQSLQKTAQSPRTSQRSNADKSVDAALNKIQKVSSKASTMSSSSASSMSLQW
jgi:hypothetical protein